MQGYIGDWSIGKMNVYIAPEFIYTLFCPLMDLYIDSDPDWIAKTFKMQIWGREGGSILSDKRGDQQILTKSLLAKLGIQCTIGTLL